MYESQYNETYEVLSAALAFHMAYEQALADGKLSVTDASYLLGPVLKLPAAINGADKALTELKVLTPEARGEMLSKLAAEYSIPDQKLEAKVEAGIEWLLATGKFIGTLSAKA